MRLRESTTSPLNRRQPRTEWRSPNRDRAMFFAFFSAGVLAILALKVLVDSQLVVTVVPCALMLWYAALLWDFDESRARYDSAGDNLYYLGFLYTLTSLAYSLYRFTADEGDTGIIVTNFGIAIATTILGMALRILVARPVVDDPAVTEDAARLELATAARKLRAEMSYIVATFRGALEEDIENVSRGVKTFTQQLEQGLTQFHERLSQEAEEVCRVTSQTVERLQAVEHSMERVEDGMNTAALALIARVQELGESTSSIKSFTEAVHRLDGRIVEAVEMVKQHSGALASGADEIRNSLEEQAKGIGDIDFRRAFDGAIKPASNELRSAAVEFKELLNAMREADVLREQALLRGKEATAALQQTLAMFQDLSDVMANALGGRKLNDFANSFNAISDQMSQFRESAGNAARQLLTVHDELLDSARQIRETNAQLTAFSSILEAASRQRKGVESPRVPKRQASPNWLARFRSWWRRGG